MPWVPANPYLINVTVADDKSGITVTVKNDRTGESRQAVTESDGTCNVDLNDPQDFPTGYSDGDSISISATGYYSKTTTVDLTNAEAGRDIALPVSAMHDLTLSNMKVHTLTISNQGGG